MFIYHYSKEIYHDLQTRANLGNATKEELKKEKEEAERWSDPGSYYEHISFFMDKAPLDILPKIFKGKHEFWAQGSEIYEYTVDVDTLEKDIIFRVVETKCRVDARTNSKYFGNVDDDNEDAIKFFRDLAEQQIRLGERGASIELLKKQLNIHQGKIRKYWLEASKRKDFMKYAEYYAAFIPHLMLYPSKGLIKYESADKVTVGTVNKQPDKIFSVENIQSNWLKW